MKVLLNFGGFYNSNFDSLIDDVIYEDDDENTIDFKNLHNEISKDILTSFEQSLFNRYDLDITFKFIELDSPKYYNYSTDKILLEISKEDCFKLDFLVVDNEDVEDGLKSIVDYITTSRSGYIPFYNYNEVMAKVNKENKNIYYQCLLEAIYFQDEIFEMATENIRNTIYTNV